MHSLMAVTGLVWLSHQEALFQFDGARVVRRIAWADLQREEPAISLLRDPARGGSWLGFRDGGVAYFRDGKIQNSYGKSQGMGDGMVRDLYIDGSRYALGVNRRRSGPADRWPILDVDGSKRATLRRRSLDQRRQPRFRLDVSRLRLGAC